jgi:hypothetical protein
MTKHMHPALGGNQGRPRPFASIKKPRLDSKAARAYQNFVSVNELVMHLPRREKLQLMESLWVDLNQAGEEVESPAWHEAVLRETERSVGAGEEEMLDWEEAKRRLRGRR